MTSYVSQMTLGPVISSMAGNDKGDFSNRVKCTGEQMKNTLTSGVAGAAVAGTGYLTAKHLAKNPRQVVKIANGIDKFALKYLPKCAEQLAKIGKKTKVGALVLIPLSMAANFISNRFIYKQGQIDQKYTDRAKVERHNTIYLA